MSTKPRTAVSDVIDGEFVVAERAEDYDFAGEYEMLVANLAREFLPEYRTLTDKARELVDLLAGEFRRRYRRLHGPLDPPLGA